MAKKQSEVKKQPSSITKIQMSQVKLPSMKEDTRSKFVKFGDKNLFPNYLLELMKRSALHNAILVSKSEAVVGGGFTYEGENSEDNTDEKTDKWLANPNPTEDADSLLRKCAYDYEVFKGYYMSIIWSNDKTSIAETYHYDFSTMRAGKRNEKGVITEFYYSENWATHNPKYKTIKAYDSKDLTGEQIIFVSPYVPGQNYYPLPAYVGALAWIETDAEIANFHLANVKNGMNPGMIVTLLGGDPSDEEKFKTKKEFKGEFEGSDNAGNFIIGFAGNKDMAPIITQMDAGRLDKQFAVLNPIVLQNILSGHRIVSPMLVGIKTEGQMGGDSEMMNSFSVYQRMVIDPDKKIILDTFNKIGAINGLKELSILKTDPVDFMFSENILEKILTKDEMRAMIGKEPKEIKPVE